MDDISFESLLSQGSLVVAGKCLVDECPSVTRSG